MMESGITGGGADFLPCLFC